MIQKEKCRPPYKGLSRVLRSGWLLFVVLALTGGMGNLFAYDGNPYWVKLAWEPSLDTNVIGTYIYMGASASRQYTNVLDVGGANSVILTNLAPNTTYYFTASSYDSLRNESDFCNEVVYTTPISLGLGTWPTLIIPGWYSTNMVTWTPTNFFILVTNQTGNGFFKFETPNMIQTTNQPN